MKREKETFEISLEKAKKSIQTADHLTYVTYNIVKEQRLLLKIIEDLKDSLLNLINSTLQYEYYYKRIRIWNEAKENFNTFKKICPWYNISQEEISKIIEIIRLFEKHKKSPFEFVKNNKIVIMSDNLKTDILTLEKVKEFLVTTKMILSKVESRLSKYS
jgi:hypothetical protein